MYHNATHLLWTSSPRRGSSKNSEHVPVFKLSSKYYAKIVILAQWVPPKGVCPLTRESSAPTKVINNKEEDINTPSLLRFQVFKRSRCPIFGCSWIPAFGAVQKLLRVDLS